MFPQMYWRQLSKLGIGKNKLQRMTGRGAEQEELRVGKDGWKLGRKGEEPQVDSWSKKEVKKMVEWVVNNGYVKQGCVLYK